MHRAYATEANPVAQHHMAGELAAIAQGAIVADNAIMPNMAIGKDPAIIAHGSLPFIAGTAVNGHKFADGTVIANLNRGFFLGVFAVLGNGANYGSGEDAAILANAGPLHNGHIRPDPGAFAYFNVLMDNGKRIHLHICGQPCVGMYISMRMDHAGKKMVTF
jgi:hypothetical protein